MNSQISGDHPVTAPVVNHGATTSPLVTAPSKKGVKFWLIFASMWTSMMLTALEISSVSTALPVIAHSLDMDQFTWVGSAYALTATAFIPMSGGLAQVFGRRPTLLLTICLFALGSAICGGASTADMLIAGRAIQGFGGGGIQSVTEIVLADLTCLKERGLYYGLISLVWCVAASIGPVIGGSLAMNGQYWRWLFYLNVPISAAASVAVLLFLDLPIPPGSFREKLGRIDWIGNLLVISSTTAFSIGLIWGGTTFPWKSLNVLGPLILGLLGLGIFFAYEAKYPKFPLVPLSLMGNWTSFSGYVQVFLCQIVVMIGVYFAPVYFQACKAASPVHSGIYALGFATYGVTAILGGLSVTITSRYRPQIWTSWIFTIVAFCLMSMVSATDPIGRFMGFASLLGLGTGCLQSTSVYPVQAPISVTQSGPSLAFMLFLHWFATMWGVTIGSTVLQNEFSKRIPASLLASIPQRTDIVYVLVPEIPTLPVDARDKVQAVFASSLSVVWRISAYISAAGFVVSLFMKGLPLTRKLDPEWTMQNEKEKPEKRGSRTV